ncbi:MAG: hypothetical protein AB2A00_16915 [Myxococcota bacterium]
MGRERGVVPLWELSARDQLRRISWLAPVTVFWPALGVGVRYGLWPAVTFFVLVCGLALGVAWARWRAWERTERLVGQGASGTGRSSVAVTAGAAAARLAQARVDLRRSTLAISEMLLALLVTTLLDVRSQPDLVAFAILGLVVSTLLVGVGAMTALRLLLGRESGGAARGSALVALLIGAITVARLVIGVPGSLQQPPPPSTNGAADEMKEK